MVTGDVDQGPAYQFGPAGDIFLDNSDDPLDAKQMYPTKAPQHHLSSVVLGKLKEIAQSSAVSKLTPDDQPGCVWTR